MADSIQRLQLQSIVNSDLWNDEACLFDSKPGNIAAVRKKALHSQPIYGCEDHSGALYQRMIQLISIPGKLKRHRNTSLFE